MQEIAAALEQGNLFNAFGYFDAWSLESVDHTLRYLVDGYVDPYSTSAEPFAGLLASGGLLAELLVTLPEQLVTALGESTAPESATAVTTALPDLLSGLL